LVSETLSKSQIDKLGERLKSDVVSDSDLELLDRFRRTFGPAYETVVSTIRDTLKMEPTGRPAKTIESVREKLRRESMRLTQIQDIAGCRIVIPAIHDQDRAVIRLGEKFGDGVVVDRRQKPSYGYRAVHVIVRRAERQVEIQIRTELQHQWAEVSEKAADSDPGIKYGKGDPEQGSLLSRLSDAIYEHELISEKIRVASQSLAARPSSPETEQLRVQLETINMSWQQSHQDYVTFVRAHGKIIRGESR
jgi:putative GTP pyrophosphokinase